jgi:hypothetical protein
MGGDVDGLSCRLHRLTNCGWQVRVYNPLIGVVSSHHTVQAGVVVDHILGWVLSPWIGLSALVLTTRVSGGLDLLWRSSPLPRRT